MSVIVPAYNAEKTVGEALASVFAQTYRDFEIVVVDDGSTDGTRALLAGYGSQVTCVHQANAGPGRARNAGIRHARGALVAFLDADDVWLPEKLARQVEYFDEFPVTGLLHTGAFLESGSPARLAPPQNAARATACQAPHSPPRHLFCEIFETDVEVRTLTVMVPRRVLDETGAFDERREMHVEDWDLWLRIAARYPVGYLPCPLAIHRDGGIMSAGLDSTFAGQMLVIEQALPEYQRQCAASNRNAAEGLRTPLYRIAWELGQAHFERTELAEARRAFRTALRARPWDAKARLYHMASHLPARAIHRLRRAKRRHLAAPPGLRAAPERRGKRVRRGLVNHVHHIDDVVRGRLGRPRRILFETASPSGFAALEPISRRLRLDPRVELYWTAPTSGWPTDSIFRSAGIFDRVISLSEAARIRFDACVTADCRQMARLDRCSMRLQVLDTLQCGDDPDESAVDNVITPHPDAVLFPNLVQLVRAVETGRVDPRAALLVGCPRIDRLVNGSLDEEQVSKRLGLRQGLPTVLYAPTPSLSIDPCNNAFVRPLTEAGFNVLIMPHARSGHIGRPSTAGPDQPLPFLSDGTDDRVRVVDAPDPAPYLMAAGALLTDGSSIGFEYTLLDRPIVIIDSPHERDDGRSGRRSLTLRAAAEVVTGPHEVQAAIVRQLVNPLMHADDRRKVAERTFYRPGTATDRAVASVYDAVGLEAVPCPYVETPEVAAVSRSVSRRAS